MIYYMGFMQDLAGETAAVTSFKSISKRVKFESRISSGSCMLIRHLVSKFENSQCISGLLLPNETIVAECEVIVK
jgi:ABC-type uncharacterized transport system auxiliary subunit